MVTRKVVLGKIIEVDFRILMMAPTVLLWVFLKVICAYLVACVGFMQASILLDFDVLGCYYGFLSDLSSVT